MLDIDDLLAKVTALEELVAQIAREEKASEENALISLPNEMGNQVNFNPYSVLRGTVISISGYEHMRVKDHWIDCDGILYATEELCRRIHNSCDSTTLIHFG